MRWDVDYGFKVGDEVTIAGVWETVPNPDRKWWQFWRPKMIKTGRYARFTITDCR